MRRIHCYAIRKESYEDQIAAGRWNPCLEIVFRDRKGEHTHKISAGNSDVIHVYREGNETFVLSVNDPLGYVGLEVFDGDDKQGDAFLQGEQVTEVLGRDDLAPFTMIRRMMEMIG